MHSWVGFFFAKQKPKEWGIWLRRMFSEFWRIHCGFCGGWGNLQAALELWIRDFLSFKHSICAHQKRELCCYLPIGGTSALLRFAGATCEQTPGFDSVRMQQQAPCGTWAATDSHLGTTGCNLTPAASDERGIFVTERRKKTSKINA